MYTADDSSQELIPTFYRYATVALIVSLALLLSIFLSRAGEKG